MEARRTLPQGRRHIVSIISGEPDFPPQQVLVQGFSTGARRALPGVEIRSDYSSEYDNQATCERIANRQIDAGSGVVFAAAGDCALGALSAAAIRGVWGVANAEDLSHLGPHILASASQRYYRLVELSVSWYLEGRLPPGGTSRSDSSTTPSRSSVSTPTCPRRSGQRSRKKPLAFERGKRGSPSDGLTSCGLTGPRTKSSAAAVLFHSWSWRT